MGVVPATSAVRVSGLEELSLTQRERVREARSRYRDARPGRAARGRRGAPAAEAHAATGTALRRRSPKAVAEQAAEETPRTASPWRGVMRGEAKSARRPAGGCPAPRA